MDCVKDSLLSAAAILVVAAQLVTTLAGCAAGEQPVGSATTAAGDAVTSGGGSEKAVTAVDQRRWELSEFLVFLGWPLEVDCPDDAALIKAAAEADFNVIMWDVGKLPLCHRYGLKLMVHHGDRGWEPEGDDEWSTRWREYMRTVGPFTPETARAVSDNPARQAERQMAIAGADHCGRESPGQAHVGAGRWGAVESRGAMRGSKLGRSQHVVDERRDRSVQRWAHELATGDDCLVVVPAVDVAVRADVDRDEADSPAASCCRCRLGKARWPDPARPHCPLRSQGSSACSSRSELPLADARRREHGRRQNRSTDREVVKSASLRSCFMRCAKMERLRAAAKDVVWESADAWERSTRADSRPVRR